MIQSWAEVISIEQFFEGVEERAITLPEAQRGQLLDRLQFARDLIGTQDPLDFFQLLEDSERTIPAPRQQKTIQLRVAG